MSLQEPPLHRETGGRPRIEIGPPLPLSLLVLLLMGEVCSFGYQVSNCDAMFTEILRRAIPRRYRLAVCSLPYCSWATTGQSSVCKNQE